MRLWGLKLTNLGHFFCKVYFLYVWRSRKFFLTLPSLPIPTSGSPRRWTWSKCQDWGENVRIEVQREICVKFIDWIVSLIKMSGLRWNCQKWGAAAAVPSVYCWKELHTSVKISVSIYAIALNSQKRCVCVWEGGYFLWFSQSQFHPHQFYGSYSLSACKKSQLSPWPCPSSWSSWRQGWWRCEG